MGEFRGLQALDADLVSFTDRLAELRSSMPLIEGAEGDLVEAALIELDFAAEELHTVRDELALHSEGLAQEGGARERERLLLRHLFHQLPAPVVLLTSDGTVRRLNEAAGVLLGVSPGFATGRPFPIFVELRYRAALRSHLAAMNRDGEPRHLRVRVTGKEASQHVLVVFKPLTAPGEPAPAALALILPVCPDEDVPAAQLPGAQPAQPHTPPAGAPRHTVLATDVLDQMTILLLDTGVTGEAVLVSRAARLLAARLADWVVVDLAGDDGLTRAAVAGPEDGETSALATLLREAGAAAAPVVAEVAETGRSRIFALVEDVTLLGRHEGEQLLARLEAKSLVCVPLRAEEETLGAVALVRGYRRPPFAMAEVGLLETLCRHLALAVRRERIRGAGRSP